MTKVLGLAEALRHLTGRGLSARAQTPFALICAARWPSRVMTWQLVSGSGWEGKILRCQRAVADHGLPSLRFRWRMRQVRLQIARQPVVAGI